MRISIFQNNKNKKVVYNIADYHFPNVIHLTNRKKPNFCMSIVMIEGKEMSEENPGKEVKGQF